MIKPKRLYKGDTIATISLSWGGAGDIPHRYQQGVRQLIQEFDLEVVPTKHSLRSADWIYKNPEARANDLMEALLDPNIKAIISNVGGEDSVRTLPYVDFNVIRENPKIFIGFSDTTVTHFCFYKAGVTSFYGTSLLTGFAENQGMFPYQVADIKDSLFNEKPRGLIKPNTDGWSSERLEWFVESNNAIKRKRTPCSGWRWLQGKGKVTGPLLGGCIEVFEFIRETKAGVTPEEWAGKIMFMETSEEKMSPDQLRWILRNYAACGIFNRIKALLIGRPYDNKYAEEYDREILKVIRDEEGLEDLIIVSGMDFGHTDPTLSLPLGINAEVDADLKSFSIIENACVE